MVASLPIGEADFMLIKAADDPRPNLKALDALLAGPGLSPWTRGEIEREIRMIRAGAKGERDAAYEIEFHCGRSKNQATIHGLRIEVGGRTAQIDHLIINRLLDIWVCESKHFSEGVRINEHGEWEQFFHGRPIAIPSPIEQNRKHIAVLDDAFATGLVPLPKRLGVSVKPRLSSLVLVSNDARIARPEAGRGSGVKDLESVIKVERAITTINESFDERSPGALLKVVTTGELETLARRLAALHVPRATDWAGRFGLRVETEQARSSTPPANGRPTCSSCGCRVSDAVIAFCKSRAEQFHGAVYCLDCQIPIVSAVR